MYFNSIPFFIYFCGFFTLYFAVSKIKSTQQPLIQNTLLLVASYFFYGIVDWSMLFLLFASTILFFFFGKEIRKQQGNKRSTILTVLSVVIGIGMLLYFKYFNFFIDSITSLMSAIGLQIDLPVSQILAPLGISYFSFKLISYIIEIRRGNIEPESNLVNFACYIAFFPTIMSGPIDRPKFMLQLKHTRTFNYDMAMDGTIQFSWGLLKKMLIADNIAIFVNKVWENMESYSGSTLAVTAILFCIQIYADFSGYSDMAIGVGKIMGINVTPNFKYPFFARNISEFWKKWHISLTSWLTDYIYITLGGSRCGNVKRYRNIFLVFLASGLWHGADWTFILWGIFHGLLFAPLLFSRDFFNKGDSQSWILGLPRPLDFAKMVGIFLLVSFGFILFKASSVEQFFAYINHMFSFSLFSMPDLSQADIPTSCYFKYLAFFFLIEWYRRKKEYPLQFSTEGRSSLLGVTGICLAKVLLCATIALLIVYFGKYGWGNEAAFIYFKF